MLRDQVAVDVCEFVIEFIGILNKIPVCIFQIIVSH
jgi:hypothetical protein